MKVSATLCLVWMMLAAGCAETGQDRVAVPLFVAGADVSEPIMATGDVPVAIERADLAFGPLYLCAGNKAGDLCDTARLEWLDTVVVDAASPERMAAGELAGVTGPVRSWMYDLGISSQLSRSRPYVLDAAHELDGASIILEGRAEVEGIELPFSASLPIQQTGDTELGVPVIRKGDTDTFSHDVGPHEPGLVVRFDPAGWVKRIDFRPYVTAQTCAEVDGGLACDGTLERACDDGAEVSSRDCAELEQVCIPGRGCAEQLTVETDSEAYRSLRNALVGARPSFEWE